MSSGAQYEELLNGDDLQFSSETLSSFSASWPHVTYKIVDCNVEVIEWKAGKKIFDIRDIEIEEEDLEEDLIGKEIESEDIQPGDKIKVYSVYKGKKQEQFFSKVTSIERNMINAVVLSGSKNPIKPGTIHGYVNDKNTWIFELVER